VSGAQANSRIQLSRKDHDALGLALERQQSREGNYLEGNPQTGKI